MSKCAGRIFNISNIILYLDQDFHSNVMAFKGRGETIDVPLFIYQGQYYVKSCDGGAEAGINQQHQPAPPRALCLHHQDQGDIPTALTFTPRAL